MPAIAWSDFDALPDVLANDRFQFLLAPSINSGLNATLAIRCQQVSVPQEIFDVMIIGIQGFEFNFRGRHTFDKVINATFVETADGAVTDSIAGWMQQVGGTESGSGATKSDYSTQGTLNVFDQSGNTALSCYLDNCWPHDAPSVQLDGSQTAPYVKQIGFTYDRFEWSTQPPQ